MKTIIAGSRGLSKTQSGQIITKEAILKSKFKITQVVCGCCPGADIYGYNWARENQIPIIFFPAWDNQWIWAEKNSHHGEKVELIPKVKVQKIAGLVRNTKMTKYADALIAIWNGISRGTKDMIDKASRAGLDVYVHRI